MFRPAKLLFVLALISLSFIPSFEAPTVDDVYQRIVVSNIRHPKIVLRQAIIESGWFKTRFFQRTNNLFGFKGKKGYMKFPDWQSSVDYYKHWQDKRYRDTTEDYYHFLKRIRYASSKVYIPTLKKVRLPKLSDSPYEPIIPKETDSK